MTVGFDDGPPTPEHIVFFRLRKGSATLSELRNLIQQKLSCSDPEPLLRQGLASNSVVEYEIDEASQTARLKATWNPGNGWVNK